MYKVICESYMNIFETELNNAADQGYRISKFLGWKDSVWIALMTKGDES